MARTVGFFWRNEGPTWLVLIATFCCWAGLIFFHDTVPWYAVVILGGLIVTVHSSLVHESVHCMRSAPDWLRVSLFLLPVGLWYPYSMYVRSHKIHHRDANLADPDRDPESFYYRQEDWQRLGWLMKKIMVANQTFAGRMILGPFIAIIRLVVGEIRCYRNGDKNVLGTWTGHLAGIIVLFAIVSGWAGMPWWQYVVLVAWPGLAFSLIRSFTEHRSGDTPEQRTAIVESGAFFGLLFLNNNFHVVHHLIPSMKWYDIPGYYRQHREEIAKQNEGFVFKSYGDVIRRYLFRPTFVPVLAAPRKVAL